RVRELRLERAEPLPPPAADVQLREVRAEQREREAEDRLPRARERGHARADAEPGGEEEERLDRPRQVRLVDREREVPQPREPGDRDLEEPRERGLAPEQGAGAAL